MSRISIRKTSTLALLTSVVFTVSSLAPVELAPGSFSPDSAFAKSENGKGGGNGGGNGGGKSSDRGGKGGEKSTASGSGRGQKSTASGGKGGGKGLAKGVGGMVAKATAEGGNLINSVFGKDKAKAKKAAKTQKATAPANNPKTKPKDMLAALEYHPSDVKGWNGVFNANPNAAKHASVNSIHGRAAAAFAQQMIADAAAADALAAAEAYEAALEHLDLDSIDPDLTGADYDAAVAALAEERLAELPDELATAIDSIDPALTGADYDAAVAALTEANTLETEALTDFADTQAAAQDLQETADLAQADAQSAFEAVTPNVEYTPEKAADFYSMMEQNEAMMERVNDIVEAEAAAAEEGTVEAEAAAAEEGIVEGEPVAEQGVVELKTGDGETVALTVQ